MKVLRNGEVVEQPIEMILPMYVHAKYKLMWSNIEITVEQLEVLTKLTNEFKTVTTLNHIVSKLSDIEKEVFERLTYIEPFNAKDLDYSDFKPNENSIALKAISKNKGFDTAYLNESLSPMFPGRKSIPKKDYKILLESITHGIEEVQNKIKTGDLTLEMML